MKRYTLRAAIHDAKVFNQLRLEYRRTRKNRRKRSPAKMAVEILGRHETSYSYPVTIAERLLGTLRRRWQHAVEVLAIILLLR
jgi:hypothetical protein